MRNASCVVISGKCKAVGTMILKGIKSVLPIKSSALVLYVLFYKTYYFYKRKKTVWYISGHKKSKNLVSCAE